jgi:hypothetical protein
VPTAKKAAPAAKTAKAKAKKAPAGWPAKLPSGSPFPVNLGAVADAYYDKKHERLALAKQQEEALKKVADDERFLKEFIINEVPKSNQGGLMGIRAVAEIVKKDVPRVVDWSAFYAFIVADYNRHAKKKDGQQDGAFAFLQRRAGDSAIKELWDGNSAVPGVDRFTVIDVSITKR